jgi:hypothetical protein
LLVPVVGERGQWLTSLHPDWKNALQVDPKDAAEQAEIIHKMTGQQALYKLLDITDNIFSKTFSVFSGQGLNANGRMLQLVTDKIVAMSKPGGTYRSEQQLIEITVAVPPAILPELTNRIRKTLGEGENYWRPRLVEFMEYRQQMLEELKNE